MPATRALPLSGRLSVVRILIVVDLPAPFGPSRPNTVPAVAPNESPSSARTPLPYVFVRSIASIADPSVVATALPSSRSLPGGARRGAESA